MEKKEKKEFNGSGVYLSNFVAMGISLFILVLAFAAGFFAKAYFGDAGGQPAPVVTAGDGQAAKTTVTIKQVKDVFNKSVIKFGDTKSKLVVLEALDPSCPYCSIASGQNGELNKQAGAQFTLVKDGGTYEAPVEEIRKLVDGGKASYAVIYRNGHGNGEMAMKALYCAFDAGKFWPVHDLLMSSSGYDLINNTVKNDAAKTDDLVAFLSGAINQSTLKSCLDSGKYGNRMQEDTKLGDSIALGGTPAFYVNDKLYAGAYSYVDMRSTVESFLK